LSYPVKNVENLIYFELSDKEIILQDVLFL